MHFAVLCASVVLHSFVLVCVLAAPPYMPRGHEQLLTVYCADRTLLQQHLLLLHGS